jgi:NADH-quinone oxidoreductase subunit I
MESADADMPYKSGFNGHNRDMVKQNYITRLVSSVWHLGQGMYVTMLNFVRPKVTEQYPENRGKHQYFDRFRALLTMPHDANNRHRCTACGICQMNCPNGTITVVGRMEDDPATGKPKKVLDKHLYDLGSCTFCALCVQSCPQNAIEFTNQFEHSVFTKSLLVKQLNRPGSKLAEKPVEKPAAEPAEPAAKPAPEPAKNSEK